MFPGLSGKQVSTAASLYVEDVFSAFTYIGNGTTQSIVNGNDESANAALTWIKGRSAARDHILTDTVRGATKTLITNSTGAEVTLSTALTAFNSNGFSIGASPYVNTSAENFVGWTFRKAAKFFDVVTYTGNGSNRTIAHSLGVAPGMIIVKCVSSAGQNWTVFHRSLTAQWALFLNLTNAVNGPYSTVWPNQPTSTGFDVGTDSAVNSNGVTYVAYLFAHDTASDGIIQCGSFTTDGSGNATVNLGWEAQYVLIKSSSTVSNWDIVDTARGFDLSSNDKQLFANASSAENTSIYGSPSALGFSVTLSTSKTYVYMAIRKGLMRPPTDATKVFAINARTGTGAAATVTAGSITQGVDLHIAKCRGNTIAPAWQDRLRGTTAQLLSSGSAAETAYTTETTGFLMNGVTVGTSASGGNVNSNTETYINYFLKQARGFFDIVAYTGTGSAHTEAHNLGVVPELIITKGRSGAQDWLVYRGDATKRIILNTTAAESTSSAFWNNTAPTASVFTLGTSTSVNNSGDTFIAYLFATLAGVSKIGTYTGTGTTLQINCGFTAGARFVLIKRIDSTGDWYFWDTTRGIVSGNDPYLLMNSTAAEATSTDYIDPYSSGFELSSTAPAALNASGGTFLYLAIA